MSASGEPGERTISTDHPMAGNHQRQPVRGVRPPYSPSRLGPPDHRRDFSVATGLTEGDARQRLPHDSLPFGADQHERHVELTASPSTVLQQLRTCPGGYILI